MEKKINKGILILLLIASTVVGAGLGQAYNRFFHKTLVQKPVINVAEPEHMIMAETPVIFEQEYLKCGHKVTSSFPERDQLNGKTINQIKAAYTSAQAYQVSWNVDTLVIHQSLDDWCPQDRGKLRLKDYQGRVAVFQGADSQNDVLLKVTGIAISSLPPDVQESIEAGTMEFFSQDELNDAMENLDEYLTDW